MRWIWSLYWERLGARSGYATNESNLDSSIRQHILASRRKPICTWREHKKKLHTSTNQTLRLNPTPYIIIIIIIVPPPQQEEWYVLTFIQIRWKRRVVDLQGGSLKTHLNCWIKSAWRNVYQRQINPYSFPATSNYF